MKFTVLFLLFIGSLFAQVSGNATSTYDNQPIAGANITIVGTGGFYEQTLTAADGSYAFTDLADGTYRLQIPNTAALGFKFLPAQPPFTISGGAPLTKNFPLTPNLLIIEACPVSNQVSWQLNNPLAIPLNFTWVQGSQHGSGSATPGVSFFNTNPSSTAPYISVSLNGVAMASFNAALLPPQCPDSTSLTVNIFNATTNANITSATITLNDAFHNFYSRGTYHTGLGGFPIGYYLNGFAFSYTAQYSLTVTAPGYATQVIPVSFVAGQITNLNVGMH